MTTSGMLANAGTMTLSFVGQYTGGDIDTAIDLVTINGNAAAVPEPGTAGLLGLAFAGLFGRRFLRRR